MSKTLPVSQAQRRALGLAIAQMVAAPAYAAKPTKLLVLQAQGDDLAPADERLSPQCCEMR